LSHLCCPIRQTAVAAILQSVAVADCGLCKRHTVTTHTAHPVRKSLKNSPTQAPINADAEVPCDRTSYDRSERQRFTEPPYVPETADERSAEDTVAARDTIGPRTITSVCIGLAVGVEMRWETYQVAKGHQRFASSLCAPIERRLSKQQTSRTYSISIRNCVLPA
jgi:hypothetical protein